MNTKICYLAHNLKQDNGGGVFASHVIEGAQKSGFEVVALVTEGGSGKPYERAILPKGKWKFILRYFAIRRELKSADSIHAFDLQPYGYIALLGTLFLNKRIVLTAIGSGSIIPLYTRMSFLAKWCYARMGAITAISQFTKNEILSAIPPRDISIIHPGIDFSFWQAESNNSRMTLPKKYIVSVGSLRWRKGYSFSIEAFKRVRQQIPDVEYVIVGKKYTDKQYGKLQKQIKENKLESVVHILDTVNRPEDLREIYKRAEVFFLLSQNDGHDVEGFGIVFLEAAACGLPVVGSRGCGVEDAVDQGQNGLLVDSKDVEGAAQALMDILRNDERRKSMGSRSQDFARSFDWSNKTPQYSTLYRMIAGV